MTEVLQEFVDSRGVTLRGGGGGGWGGGGAVRGGGVREGRRYGPGALAPAVAL